MIKLRPVFAKLEERGNMDVIMVSSCTKPERLRPHCGRPALLRISGNAGRRKWVVSVDGECECGFSGLSLRPLFCFRSANLTRQLRGPRPPAKTLKALHVSHIRWRTSTARTNTTTTTAVRPSYDKFANLHWLYDRRFLALLYCGLHACRVVPKILTGRRFWKLLHWHTQRLVFDTDGAI